MHCATLRSPPMFLGFEGLCVRVGTLIGYLGVMIGTRKKKRDHSLIGNGLCFNILDRKRF
jgi:hypothetical protein